MLSSEKILEVINPPLKITSFEHINSIVNRSDCLTLIEMPFFERIKQIVKQICDTNVEGDVVVVGVFKGGGALYLKALFEEYGVYNKWWLFDSFKGFNKTGMMHLNDIESLKLFSSQIKLHQQPTAQSVYHLFKKYDLHRNLNIVEGFIEDTLPGLDISGRRRAHCCAAPSPWRETRTRSR